MGSGGQDNGGWDGSDVATAAINNSDGRLAAGAGRGSIDGNDTGGGDSASGDPIGWAGGGTASGGNPTDGGASGGDGSDGTG
jgi:hypothetical protein